MARAPASGGRRATSATERRSRGAVDRLLDAGRRLFFARDGLAPPLGAAPVRANSARGAQPRAAALSARRVGLFPMRIMVMRRERMGAALAARLVVFLRRLSLLLLLRRLLLRWLLSQRCGWRLGTVFLDLAAFQLVGHCLKLDTTHCVRQRFGVVRAPACATEQGFGLIAVSWRAPTCRRASATRAAISSPRRPRSMPPTSTARRPNGAR